jgi:prevent-host-death family protein
MAEEMSVRDLRAKLADVLNDAAVRGKITYVTSRGRRVAAVVPLPVAERADVAGRGRQPKGGHDGDSPDTSR